MVNTAVSEPLPVQAAKQVMEDEFRNRFIHPGTKDMKEEVYKLNPTNTLGDKYSMPLISFTACSWDYVRLISLHNYIIIQCGFWGTSRA